METPEFKTTDYWQFKALSIEWVYMLSKLEKSVTPSVGEQHAFTGLGLDGNPLYLLMRKYYTPAVISKATGLKEEALAKFYGVITLKSKEVVGLKDATVPYWGIA